MTDIDLSIIIPIYNVEKYLIECLDSVYQLKIIKEVILINDKSPDNSLEIIKKYKKKYPKETITINHKENMGLSEARNSGLKIAKGRYISFIDSDDIIIPKQYEKIFFLNKNRDLDIIMANGNEYKNNLIGKRFYRNLNMTELGVISGKKMLEKMLEKNSYYEMVCLNFYKRTFLIKNNLFFFKKLLHEDTLFTFSALLKAKEVNYIDIDFYLYRQREGSITYQLSLKNAKHVLFICDKLIHVIKSEPNINVEILKYIFNLYWFIFRRNKLQNSKLLCKIVLLKTNSIKIFIKKIILLMSYLFCKKIKKIEII